MKKSFVKVLSSLAAGILLLAACGGGGEAATNSDKLTVGMVTDTGGAHDKSFNQGTIEGIEAYVSKHENEWKMNPPIESSGESDFGTNLKQAATKNNVVVASGYLFETVIQEVAKESSDVDFIGIDIDLTGKDIPSNLATYVFAEEQASFLAGVAAAEQTKTNKLGFIGGMKVPAVQKFGWGFVMGAKHVNPDIEIIYDYSGSFDDDALGSQKAKAMFDNGVDIIHAAAGQTGVGVIQETIVQRQNGKDVWMVGVDLDQYEDGMMPGTNESVVLTSAVKKLDIAIATALEGRQKDAFPGGQTTLLTIDDDAVGLPELNPNLSDEIIASVDKAKEAIKKGEITPPSTRDEVDGKNIIGEY